MGSVIMFALKYVKFNILNKKVSNNITGFVGIKIKFIYFTGL